MQRRATLRKARAIMDESTQPTSAWRGLLSHDEDGISGAPVYSHVDDDINVNFGIAFAMQNFFKSTSMLTLTLRSAILRQIEAAWHAGSSPSKPQDRGTCCA
jgi:hypothetical protein